jgi:AraC family transcriptional regulator
VLLWLLEWDWIEGEDEKEINNIAIKEETKTPNCPILHLSKGDTMNAQIKKVTYYIETHLDDELDGELLAKVAGYSQFHFCRIFKINMGESVMSYTTRLRLERASADLNYDRKSIIEVALDAGYKTPTGFLKAFKLRFGTTPTNYKRSAKTQRNKYKDIQMETPKIVTREEAYVVFTRELGDYTKSSHVAWTRLTESMNGLSELFQERPPKTELNLGIRSAEAIGICHDDPEVTKEENLRYDASLAWGKVEVETLADYGFETKTISGGKYAKVLYKGNYKKAEENWYGLYVWIEKNGYEFRDEPAFEKYLNMPGEVEDDEILTEIYVPVK